MNTVLEFFKAGGFVMYPLLVLSLAALVIIVERLLAFHQIGSTAPRLTDEVLSLIQDGRFEEARRLANSKRGPVAQSIATILENRTLPEPEIERLVEEAAQPFFQQLERFLPILDTTTTISPLLGLLGTIVGMIGTFNAIAAQQAHGSNDSVLAGVGEALYATATGLCIAVICFVAYNYFASRLRFVISETQQGATRTINGLAGHHAARLQKEDLKNAV